MSDADLLIALTLAAVASGHNNPIEQAKALMAALKKEIDKL